METLGFINHISNHPYATQKVLDNIREFYPNAPIFLSVDGSCSDRYTFDQYINEDYEWLFNNLKLGYPPYSKEQVLEWLKRMYIGVLKLNTKHFCMIEDDCIILNPITYDEDWECVGHVIPRGNKINPFILEEIERISKVKPKTDYYGNGGGSIFKIETFIDNYPKIIKYFEQWWSLYHIHFYPQCGYMDCYMTLFYMLCGKDYTPNPRLKNLDPHSEFEITLSKTNETNIIMLYKNEYDMVHNWKAFY